MIFAANAQRAIEIGPDAEARLAAAPALLDRLLDEWRLGDPRPMADARCSVLISVQRDGQEAVLKVPLDVDEATYGVQALRAFSGHGGVTILEVDEPSGTVLMPRMGVSLAQENPDDEVAVRVCAEAILNIRRGDPAGGKPVEEWYDWLLAANPCELPHEVLRDVQSVLNWLIATTEKRRLCHGDLHHLNLLRSDGGYVVIDPKGLSVDPSFEISAFMRNLQPYVTKPPDLYGRMARRIELFAELLGDPIERLWGWSFVEVATSVEWKDPSDDWSLACLEIAQALRRMPYRPTGL